MPPAAFYCNMYPFARGQHCQQTQMHEVCRHCEFSHTDSAGQYMWRDRFTLEAVATLSLAVVL